MRSYNILQAIFMSFYSKNLYRDVAINWGGKAFLYLLFLLALSWIAVTYQIQHGINQIYYRNSDKIIAQIPILHIQEGKVSTPENRPYFIKDPDTNKEIAVIDTTGQYTTLEQTQTTLLVTKDTIITRTKPDEIKSFEIANSVNGIINPEQVNSFVKAYIGYAWIILFLFFVIFSYFYRIIQALIYALIGKIFSSIMGIRLTYGQIILIAMVAITPVIIVSSLFEFFNVSFPYHNLFYFALALIYLCYGISANKLEQHSP